MEVQVRIIEKCYKCDIEIDGYSVKKSGGYCPRCAYPIDHTIDMDDGSVLSPEAEEARRGAIVFCELMAMLSNWRDGYLNVVAERGVDWSLPHEYLQEFVEHMCPYIARLKEMGYSTPERMKAIGDTMLYSLELIIQALRIEEDNLKLAGKWNEDEQGIKDYWLEKTPKLAYLLCGAECAEFEALAEEGCEA